MQLNLIDAHDAYENTWKCGELNSSRALTPLPILIPSNFVKKNGLTASCKDVNLYFSPSARMKKKKKTIILKKKETLPGFGSVPLVSRPCTTPHSGRYKVYYILLL